MRRSLRATKRLTVAPKWTVADDRGATRLTVALECDDPDLTGIALCLRTNANTPDADLSAQLFVSLADHDWRIERIDWRPRNPHTNRTGSADLKGLTVETGIHSFEENTTCGLAEMQAKNLPLVVPLKPEPQTFDELLAVARVRFSIVDTSSIPDPPWSPNLFPLV
ncbi:hypothetical protein V5F41_02890 [Xanthobacter autotrophicus]|uniref:hypothetical protein n=1 Tax=Xanthobacter autotrophicus TaxID=280 RepID=UPI0037281278